MGKNVIFLELLWAHLCILIEKNVLILGEGPTQGLDDTALTAEAHYLINFSRLNRTFCLSMHYNGSNSLLFVNATVQSKRFWNEKKKIIPLGNILGDV